MTTTRALWILFPFCFTLFLYDLTAPDLWSSHEARAAQNAQRMIDDGDWGLPRLYDGQAELQKPPAFYWFVAAIAELRGGTVDRWAVRLPSTLAALLTVFLVWHWLAAQGRTSAGLIAGMVLASSLHFTSLARTGRIDMSLTAAITASLFLLEGAAGRRCRALLAGLTLALAILLKGPIGIALPLAVLGVWVRWQRLWPIATSRCPLGSTWLAGWMPPALAAMLGITLASPWFIWMNEKTGGEFLRVFFWYHNVQRALGDAPALAIHPWWYYLPRFALDFLPWTPALFAAAWLYCRRTAARSDRSAAFGLIWLLAMVGVLSLARFKRADYLLPAFPGAAIFIGCVAERWQATLSQRGRRAVTIAFAFVSIGCLAGWWWFHHRVEPQQQAVREQQAFAAHIRQQATAPQTVLLFRVESHLLAFHLGRPVHTLVEWAELNERLAEPGTHWFVTRAEFVSECLEHVGSRRIAVAAHSETFAPAPPLRPLVLMTTIDELNSCPTMPRKD
jgi:4-amino-4-deoxy-L-arabinose transferase-like glycosyltransferase